jgi:hypothetical protein
MGADRKTPIDTHPMIIDIIVPTGGGSCLKTYKGTKKFSVESFGSHFFCLSFFLIAMLPSDAGSSCKADES